MFIADQPNHNALSIVMSFGWGVFTRVCLANQVGREEAAEKPFLEERLVTREANEKMVLEPLAYASDTL
ncbi:hypothetical protein [Laceyella tengchongensis]|uniref:hypothetical protein n=1 Tax=Laceyella tengchongensis TaxID=574699 RepID=UPI0012B9775E|nr:hypothetical protein [Laceyella tengchongensis]